MVLIFPQAEQHKLRLAAVGICCRMFNAVLRLHWITAWAGEGICDETPA